MASLARQYARYGFWKVRTLREHPGSLRWRQLVAPAFVVALLLTPWLVVRFGAVGAAVVAAYVVANLAASVMTAARNGWGASGAAGDLRRDPLCVGRRVSCWPRLLAVPAHVTRECCADPGAGMACRWRGRRRRRSSSAWAAINGGPSSPFSSARVGCGWPYR